ncbi:MAG: alcohol dehydrogenase catalytic domain-containing protein [Candidatus Sumerlaeota bacterium]|nr:alcohol dehydrogenase catalytic domain-containing protein [Candidatus Sumerlaeota bacterium]
MKALVKHTTGGKPEYRIEDVPEPQITAADEVKIKISRIGVCTSDIHVLHGAMSMPDGNIVGHEFSGVIAETGPAATRLKPGDRVVSECAIGSCGHCRLCRKGKYEFCPEKRPPGWASQGVYTEYVVMPERIVHRIADSVSLDIAALAEPVAICVYGCLERANLQRDECAVLFGLGSIGLISLIVLKDLGVERIACVAPAARGHRRLDLAKDLGADLVIPVEEDVRSLVKKNFGSDAPDCVVECSGSPGAVRQGLNLLGKDGKFVGLGIAPEDSVSIPYNSALLNAVSIIFSCTSSHSAWVTTLGILERNRPRLEKILTHSFRLEDWEKAYAALENREAVKCLLTP